MTLKDEGGCAKLDQRIQKQLDFLNNRRHRTYRRELTAGERERIIQQIRDPQLSYMQRYTLRLKLFLEYEEPVLLENTNIYGLRTLVDFPDFYTQEEWEDIESRYFIHEKGKVCNLNCDYETVLKEGLEGRRSRALKALERCKEAKDAKGEEFLLCAMETIDAVERFADKYTLALDEAGKEEHGEMIRRTVRFGAKGFLEALQFFRILHFALWCSGSYHNTVGRFDQYMWHFLSVDLEEGNLDENEALVLLEDFFISFNWDSDLYYSLQWGDNGQSLVLGGQTSEGECAVNLLTYLCLQASLELHQIDPKINLRVDKNTSFELFELGTKLTKEGLGFPQYSNDDVVIPGLVKLGYSLEHARDYVMAACWEFIVPAVAMDIPNIGAVPLANIVSDTIRKHLEECFDFTSLMEKLEFGIRSYAKDLASKLSPLFLEPAPYQSVLMANCLDEARDISKGSIYNNYGFHGTGFSCAVDQLMAVKELVFDTDRLESGELLKALDADFAGYDDLRYELRTRAPKIGNDEDARKLGDKLLRIFARSLEGLHNERGGIFRAGTGTAMYYLWHSENLPATSDGRNAGQPLPANFSPSLFIQDAGPLSVVNAFALPSLVHTINGGPLTLELHDTVFRDEDSIRKVALLVQAYILKGGHQLQLNSVNHEKLLDAQKHTEKHKDLIVRVWGWSGHFVELDAAYQNQILARTEFTL